MPSVVCIGELGLRHDYTEYEGIRVARESAVEQDKIGKVLAKFACVQR